MPLTFNLEVANAVLLLTSALLCLAASRIAMPNPFHRAAWRLTGASFTVHALHLILQHLFGGVALRAGARSATMAAYLRWTPVFDHGRTFLLYGLFLGLVLLAVYRREPDRSFWRAAAALVAGGFAVGSALGLAEGPFSIVGHFSAVAIWDVAELLLLMAALFALLITSRADRALWALLSAYGTILALGVFSFLVLSQYGLRDSWHPAPWTLQAERMVFHTLMVLVAGWRVRAGRRGRPVPAMLDRRVRPVTTLA
jgi:hypothetical protein